MSSSKLYAVLHVNDSDLLGFYLLNVRLAPSKQIKFIAFNVNCSSLVWRREGSPEAYLFGLLHSGKLYHVVLFDLYMPIEGLCFIIDVMSELKKKKILWKLHVASKFYTTHLKCAKPVELGDFFPQQFSSSRVD